MPTASYNASFLPGGGFHPTLSLTLSTPSTSCPLYALVALPPSFIADRFQLAQLHSEGRLGAYDPSSSTLNVLGERDLEAPVSRAANSSLLVRLRHAEDKGKGKEREEKEREKKVLEVEVPLHLRYQVPVQERWVDGQRMDMLQVEMPWPIVFWACEEGQDPPRATSSCPPSSIPLAYPGLASSTSLHFLSPSNASQPYTCPPFQLPTLSLSVPTGVVADLPYVETINFVAIWSGMLWVGWAALKARRRWDSKVAKEE